MDGTGKLFDPIKEFLPENIKVDVIKLSSLKGHDTESQAQELAKRLGKQEVVIFAESYSGSIAYKLAQMSDVNIKHIIFAASFLSRPSYLSKFGFIAPLSLLRLNLVPSLFLSWLFFGSSDRTDLVKLFLQALHLVSNEILRERLKIIASLTKPTKVVNVSSTYIQATKDKLVSSKSVTIFQKLFVNLQIKRIDGGHFIAQSNPKACAEVVVETFGTLNSHKLN